MNEPAGFLLLSASSKLGFPAIGSCLLSRSVQVCTHEGVQSSGLLRGLVVRAKLLGDLTDHE